MNRNHKVRNMTFGLAAGALAATAAAGFFGLEAEAAPLAGATSVISYTATESSKPVDTSARKITEGSTIAGANRAVASILAETKAGTCVSA